MRSRSAERRLDLDVWSAAAGGLAWLLGPETPTELEIDAARLLDAARSHGLLPRLYHRLRAAGSRAVPAAILDGLRREFEANARRNLHLTAELVRLLQLFEERGILAVPFKGPLLAHAAYGNLAWRQFNDLDVVVRDGDVPRAEEVLHAEGYQTYGLESSGDRVFRHRERRVVVELHWRLFPRHFAFRMDMAGLWDRLREVEFAGRRVRTFAAEDLLLILCIHGAKHGWERIAWIADVAALIRTQPSLDWEQTVEAARRVGGSRMLALGLVLAQELENAPVPDAVARLARADARALAIAAALRQRLAREPWRSLGPWETVRFHLAARERFSDRARYVALLVFVPSAEDVAFLPLPAALSFLYVVLRPLRLAGRYALRRRLSPICNGRRFPPRGLSR